jgi:hypothetical protein
MAFAVRYLILCDEVEADPNNLLRLNVFGLMTHIRSTRSPPFPIVRPRFCVLALLTDCVGPAEMSLQILHDAKGRIIFQNKPRRIQFVNAPRDAIGVKFNILNCVFPAEGIYWVELLIAGNVVARQALTLTT